MTKLSNIFLINCLLFLISGFSQKTDEYGGVMQIKGSETGFWHTEKIGDRHWFITPDGNALYLLGINHITAESENEKRQTLENLGRWNFNSSGKSTEGWLLSKYPGFIPFSLHNTMHWLPADRFNYVDVFDPAFEKHVENTVRQRIEIGKKYRGTIGYVSTDTPRYDLDISRTRRGNDWVSFTRGLPSKAKGKQEYVNFLKKRYNHDFQKFQKAYRLEGFDSFEAISDYEFQNLELTRPAIQKDDQAFLINIVERIYRLSRTNFKRFAPSAILLSDTFKMHDHTEEILKLAGNYFDVISIQAGPTMGPDAGQGPDESEFDTNYWERVYTLTNKPILLADHGFSFQTPKHARTLWHQFASEKKAAEFYDSYVLRVIAQPYILGYIKCQYKDRYDPLRSLLKQGLVNEDGIAYPILEQQIIKTNHDVLTNLYKRYKKIVEK